MIIITRQIYYKVPCQNIPTHHHPSIHLPQISKKPFVWRKLISNTHSFVYFSPGYSSTILEDPRVKCIFIWFFFLSYSCSWWRHEALSVRPPHVILNLHDLQGHFQSLPKGFTPPITWPCGGPLKNAGSMFYTLILRLKLPLPELQASLKQDCTSKSSLISTLAARHLWVFCASAPPAGAVLCRLSMGLRACYSRNRISNYSSTNSFTSALTHVGKRFATELHYRTQCLIL